MNKIEYGAHIERLWNDPAMLEMRERVRREIIIAFERARPSEGGEYFVRLRMLLEVHDEAYPRFVKRAIDDMKQEQRDAEQRENARKGLRQVI